MTRLHVENFVQVFDSVSDTITAAARDSADGFPFVTVPHFEILGSHVRAISRVEMFAFVPLITEEQRVAWQTYADQQQGWVAESRDFAVSRARAHGTAGAAEEPMYMAEPIVPFIYQQNETGHVVPAPGPGPYAPIWQVSPPPFHTDLVINYNMMAETFMPRLFEAAVFVKGVYFFLFVCYILLRLYIPGLSHSARFVIFFLLSFSLCSIWVWVITLQKVSCPKSCPRKNSLGRRLVRKLIEHSTTNTFRTLSVFHLMIAHIQPLCNQYSTNCTMLITRFRKW